MAVPLQMTFSLLAHDYLPVFCLLNVKHVYNIFWYGCCLAYLPQQNSSTTTLTLKLGFQSRLQGFFPSRGKPSQKMKRQSLTRIKQRGKLLNSLYYSKSAKYFGLSFILDYIFIGQSIYVLLAV